LGQADDEDVYRYEKNAPTSAEDPMGLMAKSVAGTADFRYVASPTNGSLAAGRLPGENTNLLAKPEQAGGTMSVAFAGAPNLPPRPPLPDELGPSLGNLALILSVISCDRFKELTKSLTNGLGDPNFKKREAALARIAELLSILKAINAKYNLKGTDTNLMCCAMKALQEVYDTTPDAEIRQRLHGVAKDYYDYLYCFRDYPGAPFPPGREPGIFRRE
jgi:hypothetical protein